MANINRDYIVQINCNFDKQYWKEFNLVLRAKPMEFKKDDAGVLQDNITIKKYEISDITWKDFIKN